MAMETGNWRTELEVDSRQWIVDKIMDTLKRHVPYPCCPNGLDELRKIAVRFEENIFSTASSQSDYLRRISSKMQTMETKYQNTMPNTGNNTKPPPDPAYVAAVAEAILVDIMRLQQFGQASEEQRGNSSYESPHDEHPYRMIDSNDHVVNMGEGIDHVKPARVPQQNLPTPQLSGYSYTSLKPDPEYPMYSPPANGGDWQEEVFQKIKALKEAYLPELTDMFHKINNKLQQHDSLPRQPKSDQIDKLRVFRTMLERIIAFLTVNKAHIAPTFKDKLASYEKVINNFINASKPRKTTTSTLQQGQSMPMPLENNQSQASAGVESYSGLESAMPAVSGVAQNPIPNVVGQNFNMPKMCGVSQSSLGQGVPSNMYTNQQRQMQGRHPVLPQQQQQPQHLYNFQSFLMQSHILQQQQQNLLPPTQLQSSQQSGMQTSSVMQPSSMQSTPLSGLQQNQQSSLQQSSQSMLHQHQQQQSQRAVPETSSTSLDSTAQTGHANGGDWQEEVFQKIKALKEAYLPELTDMFHKINNKLQQHDSLPQQPKSDQLYKLKVFRTMLERIFGFLTVNKAQISPSFKDKLVSYEKQIKNFINCNKPRKTTTSTLQQGELPPPHDDSYSMQQQQQPQINQTQSSHDSHVNPQLQSVNLQGSMLTMQPNSCMSSLQHNSLSSVCEALTAQQRWLQNMIPLRSNSNKQQKQLKKQKLLQRRQQNMIPLHSNSNMQQQLRKQKQKQKKLLQLEKQKLLQLQLQQLQQQQQSIQLQLQQLQQQQQPTQLQTHQMPQLQQLNGVNDMKMEPGTGTSAKPGFLGHLSEGQRYGNDALATDFGKLKVTQQSHDEPPVFMKPCQ